VVFDPLYRDGEPFLLPRDALERVWEGDGLILKALSKGLREPRSRNLGRKSTWLLAVLAGCLLIIQIFVYAYFPQEAHIQPPLAAPSDISSLKQNSVSSPPMNDELRDTAPAIQASIAMTKPDRADNSTSGTGTAAFVKDLGVRWSSSSMGAYASQELATSGLKAPAPEESNASGPRALISGQLFVLRSRKLSDSQPTSPARKSIQTLAVSPVIPSAEPTPPGAPILRAFSSGKAPDSVEAARAKPPIRHQTGTAHFAANIPGSVLGQNWYALTEGSSVEPLLSPVLPCVSTILSAPDAAGVPVRICQR